MNEIVEAIKLSTSMIVPLMAIYMFAPTTKDPIFDGAAALAIGIGFVTSVHLYFWMSGL